MYRGYQQFEHLITHVYILVDAVVLLPQILTSLITKRSSAHNRMEYIIFLHI